MRSRVNKKSPSVTKMAEIFGSAHALPGARRIVGALRARDFDTLRRFKDVHGSPQMYRDPNLYMKFAAFIGFFSKAQALESNLAETAAFKTFMGSCARMTFVNSNIASGHLTRDLLSVLTKASRFIGENYHFGSCASLWEQILESAKHGPGSSLDVRGKFTHPAHKATARTYSGTKLGTEVFALDPGFILDPGVKPEVVVRNYSEGMFVPKNMWTRRMIAIEPSLSIYYQLGLGAVLLLRLLFTGVDLKNGQRFNRTLARLASISGEFATIDISAASDSIAWMLVKTLFFQSSPALWEALVNLRSPFMYITVNGVEHKVQLPMFSTMGNGYTFPLETIIFQSLIEGTMDLLGCWYPYLVYGDDLIVHKDVVPVLMNVLSELGLVPNSDKSFTKGPFRESCGTDWWEGENVRPVFVKQTDGQSFYAMRNLMSLNPVYDEVVDYLDGFCQNWGPVVKFQESHVNVPRKAVHWGEESFYMPGWAWSDSRETSRYDKSTQSKVYRELIAVTPDTRFDEALRDQDGVITGAPFEGVLLDMRLRSLGLVDDVSVVNPRQSSRLATRWTHVHG